MNDIYLLYDMRDADLKKKVEAFEDVWKNGNSGKSGGHKMRRLSDYKIGSSTSADHHSRDETRFRDKKDCTESKVLIAFFNAGFFTNGICRDFWHGFWKNQENFGEKYNIPVIFPVWLGQKYVPAEKDSSEQFGIYNKAYGLGFHDVPSDTDSEDDINAFYDRLSQYVKHSISILKENEDTDEDNNENESKQRVIVGVIEKLSEDGKIDAEYLDDDVRTALDLGKDEKGIDLVERVVAPLTEEYNVASAENNKSKKDKIRTVVCAIYTGGTVGMIQDRSSGIPVLRNANPRELLENIPRLRDLDFDVHLYSYEKTIDSSNAGSDKWIEIARIIYHLGEHYNGFVVIHGANTLAYTASALSYMFTHLNKPIILTGAELPLSDISREAETNVIKSLSLASEKFELKVPEVCILYGSQFMRGNRATKKIALDTVEGFHSPNFPNLGNITTDRKTVNYTLCLEGDDYFKANISDFLDSKVAILDVYPDMDMDAFSKFCNNDLDALILRTYGTGGVPDSSDLFMETIEKLIENTTIVVSLTQSPIGYVELRLHETNAQLFDIGVINGGDMTTEAAYCKVKYLLAPHLEDYNDKVKGKAVNPLDENEIKEIKKKYTFNQFKRELAPDAMRKVGDKMMKNMKGELSMETLHIRFSDRVSINNAGEPREIKSDEFDGFDKRNLQAAVLRIRGVKSIPYSPPKQNIDIEVKIQRNKKYEALGKWIQNKDMHEKTENINIDILEGVRRFMDISPKKKEAKEVVKLTVSSKNHDLTYESLGIVLLFGGIV